MSSKSGVPDAWDDDWVNAADKPDSKSQPPPAKLTKAQRRAQHQELQKQLWDSAENPTRMHWLEAQGVVPLKQEYTQQVKLLSRKPQPTIAKKDVTNGIADLGVQDDGEDSEEEARKKREADLEERTRKAKIEREEKQKKYAEARERIMGSSNSGSSMTNSRESSQGRGDRRPRPRVNGTRNSQPTSADQSPARIVQPGDRQLFDPDDMSRRLPPKSLTPNMDGPMRQPRGPDVSGRGGFGFAGRGG
ncbi:hypothetical protein BAUCODRAFT_62329 [Baudoinia panamericana UAMH 10762]|uniref:SUZ domain-containing protein n=1 Tax=Baudoinia panamericana (strain UAMH 10762) TaxID=717646 RepID=M2NN66_BAUPA|nr:uncharacterized protein BAUCODRAFT_62329 [Baudoinia panamericana UAMH 10762]EMD00950.1 hypothetical protein BAUCODRAFT_62329 [Baudoinia panamericana UAMH 10762]